MDGVEMGPYGPMQLLEKRRAAGGERGSPYDRLLDTGTPPPLVKAVGRDGKLCQHAWLNRG